MQDIFLDIYKIYALSLDRKNKENSASHSPNVERETLKERSSKNVVHENLSYGIHRIHTATKPDN
jgi:hypothetical protein